VTPFTLSRPTIGLGNRNRFGERSFGQAEVALGPFAFTAHIDDYGHVTLPAALIDDDLHAEISTAVRALILAEVAERWAAVADFETRSLDQRKASKAANLGSAS
jgi:hypothetical protein